MHIKKTLLPLLLSLNLFAAPNGVYVEVGAALGLGDTLEATKGEFTYDRDYTGSLILGYQADLYRFEIEGKYKEEELKSFGNVSSSGELTQNSQMINAYFSGYNESKYVSSIGAGVGITNISLKNLTQNSKAQEDVTNDAIPSLQAMLSVGYMMSDNLTATTKYTYFYVTESDDFESNSDHIFTLSLRYLF